MIWLPEPTTEDDSYARRGEHPLDWLSRSTNARARECRRFLNDNLSRLPSGKQAAFLHDLRHQWDSAFFELIVARTLQELGASVDVESPTASGKRPDFLATFPDGTIRVEATAPRRFDSPSVEELHVRIPLLDFIELNLPKGWWVLPWELPQLGPSDSKGQFRAAIRRMLQIPPPNSDAEPFELREELPSGTIHLLLFPQKVEADKLAGDASVTSTDNSVSRIKFAVTRKRRQVRASPEPVLLAVHASGMSSDFTDFDRALFGHSFESYDRQSRLVESGFRSDGIFATQTGSEPTFAGVLAFLRVGFHTCTEPVLYRHPRFAGSLPGTILQLEQRIYHHDSNAIESRRSRASGFLEGLNFAKL